MIFLIVYLVGVLVSIYGAIGLWREKKIKVGTKIGLTFWLLIFSWLGYFSYTFVIKVFLLSKGQKGAGE